MMLALILASRNALAAGCTVPAIHPLTHSGAPVEPQTVHLLDPALYPNALCNDGSPAGYIFRPGTGYATQRWVVALTHYNMCQTNETCAARAHDLTSTAGLVSGVSAGETLAGILSADPAVNPDFYDANAVLVLYCSSDYFTGDKAPSLTPFDRRNAAQTWYFRGHAIAAAVLTDLLAARGLANATQLLLSGDSAGGFGVVLNANDLLPLLPAGLRTIIAPDGGLLQDIGGFDPNAPAASYVSTARPTPIETIMEQGRQFWGGRGDRVCEQAAHTALEHARCYITADVITAGYVPPPVLAVEALDDTAQLAYDNMTDTYPAPGTPGAIYAKYFSTKMKSSALRLGRHNAAFSPAAFAHQLFTAARVFDEKFRFPGPTKITPQQAVGAWYLNPCAGPKWIGVR